jgi:hypothetical protein
MPGNPKKKESSIKQRAYFTGCLETKRTFKLQNGVYIQDKRI